MKQGRFSGCLLLWPVLIFPVTKGHVIPDELRFVILTRMKGEVFAKQYCELLLHIAGFESFEQVRHRFEFTDERPPFYPPPVATWYVSHKRDEPIFSIMSVSLYGHFINPGLLDPFDYGLPSLQEGLCLPTSGCSKIENLERERILKKQKYQLL